MKIGLDCRFIKYQQIDGIARFTLSLYRELVKTLNPYEYYLICQSHNQIDFLKSWLKDRPLTCGPCNYVIANFFQIPAIIKKEKINIFFSPNYITLPLSFFCSHIVVVHDLIPFLFPQYFKEASLKFRLFFKNNLFIKFILKNVNHIITVSTSSKNDIVKYTGIQENKISVITEGVDKIDIQSSQIEQIINKYKLPAKYILYVGRYDPYKNISLLLKIFSRLGDLKENFFLVLAGKEDERYTPFLKELAKELNIEDKVIFLGFVTPEELPAIYQKSTILVHASLYEGFGLSILEAMNYGTPVVAFNTSSIPEVLKDCGILVPAYDENAFSNAITELLTNEDKRHELITKAKERAAKFNWANTAQQVLDIITNKVIINKFIKEEK